MYEKYYNDTFYEPYKILYLNLWMRSIYRQMLLRNEKIVILIIKINSFIERNKNNIIKVWRFKPC